MAAARALFNYAHGVAKPQIHVPAFQTPSNTHTNTLLCDNSIMCSKIYRYKHVIWCVAAKRRGTR